MHQKSCMPFIPPPIETDSITVPSIGQGHLKKSQRRLKLWRYATAAALAVVSGPVSALGSPLTALATLATLTALTAL